MSDMNALKRVLLETNRCFPRFCLAYRPRGIWFDERNPLFMPSMNKVNDLGIGSVVDMATYTPWIEHQGGEFNWNYNSTIAALKTKDLGNCVITGFFRINSRDQTSNLKSVDIFCSVASPVLFEKSPTRKNRAEEEVKLSIIKGGSFDTAAPVILFWANGLKEVRGI